VVKVFNNKITLATITVLYYTMRQNHSSLRFTVGSYPHHKLRKFVNIRLFTHFAKPSTQHHMPGFGLSCTKICFAAGLCLDPQGELTALSQTSLPGIGEGMGQGEEREGIGFRGKRNGG